MESNIVGEDDEDEKKLHKVPLKKLKGNNENLDHVSNNGYI